MIDPNQMQLANQYIDYLKAGECNDTTFIVRQLSLAIIQPIDDEEDSKYNIIRNEVESEVWDLLVHTITTKVKRTEVSWIFNELLTS